MLALAQTSEPTVPAAPAPVSRPMGDWLEFAGHLARKHSITGDLLAKCASLGSVSDPKRLRGIWELTDFSANDFADEVAYFYRLPRVDLPQLLAADPLTSKFSNRFLREASVF